MNSEQSKTRTIAVTSGKGGVGKTNVALNLAISLRLLGGKVVLLDADMGMANVDVLLGLSLRGNLRDVILGNASLEQVVIDGPRGVKILPGASGVEEMANLEDDRLSEFLEQLETFCADKDYLVVDTATGISRVVINCLLGADEIVLVTNAEPTALTDAYALLKVYTKRAGRDGDKVFVVLNQCGSKEEAMQGFDRLRAASGRFLGWEPQYLGSIAWDDTVSLATRQHVDFLTHYATAPCSQDIRKLAARLVSARHSGGTGPGRFFHRVMDPRDE